MEFISLNLNFLMEKKQGLRAHSSHRLGRRINKTMDTECLIGKRCSVNGGRHYSLRVGVKYQYHKGKAMPTLGPPVWQPNIYVGPKPGQAKFNLPWFSVCTIFASDLLRLAFSFIYTPVKSHFFREAFLTSSFNVASLDSLRLHYSVSFSSEMILFVSWGSWLPS